jgi:phage FluMu gp28-like protein
MTPDRIAAVRTMLPAAHARRVLDNEWIDVTESPLLTYDLLAPCLTDCLWSPDDLVRRDRRLLRCAELYMGVDIGRTRDRTVLWTIELLGDVAWTREIRVLDQTPFAVQKREIIRRIDRHVVAVRIDKGAIGYQLAEELEAEFPRIVEGMQLTAGRQGQLALQMKTAFERHRLRIPNDPPLLDDLQLVQQIETGNSGVPLLETLRGATGHADRFWAAALALAGLPMRPGISATRGPRGTRSRLSR